VKDATATARSLRRIPFALLAWVLSAAVPADLLGAACRALVMRALVNVTRAARSASSKGLAAEHRNTLAGLADRGKAAIEALGEDPRALSEEALPPPTAAIDGRIVARVLLAVADSVAITATDRASIPEALDPAWCDLIAMRASAHDVEPEDARGEPRGPP
jgi:hypothetical protein